MPTITIQTPEQSIDIRVLDNQRIKDVLQVLKENGTSIRGKVPARIYSCRRQVYIDPELTFAQAGIYNGDCLEPEPDPAEGENPPGQKESGIPETSQDGTSAKGRLFERPKELFIADRNADLCMDGLEAKVYLSTSELSVELCTDTVILLNGHRIGDGKHFFRDGSLLQIGSTKLLPQKRDIRIWADEETVRILLHEKNDSGLLFRDFPYYRRSPRIIKHIDSEKVKIETPRPSNYDKRKGILQMILPSLGMLAVTVAVGIVLHRGAYMLMALGATAMTTVLSVSKYIQDQKQEKEKNQKKAELYTDYLLGKRKEIYHLWEKEKEAWDYNYPDIRTTAELIRTYSSRIYEKNPMDEDFLTFAIGRYYGRTYFQIEDKTTDLDLNTDEYLEDGRHLKETWSFIEKPKIIDLKHAHLGLVGEKHVIHDQLKIYLSQIAMTHSYHEVQFIVVYHEKDQEQFQWMRWFRHTTLQSFNVQGLIHSETARDQVLGSLYQELKERKQRVEEGKKGGAFLPHYLFVIDEPKMIADHSIMEFLGGRDGKELGFSVIYTSAKQTDLPENMETVLSLEHSLAGKLVLEEKEYANLMLTLDSGAGVDFEWMARDLSVLIHERGMTSRIPEMVSFLDLYQVEKPEEMRIEERWSRNHAAKSLEVPLGMRTGEDKLYLNLHEKAHGPHGLIAGTTGSGKSELIQSYILSLAVNFHPYEVGFLLIDYKGGGMADQFRDLPHLLGTITNLDGSESLRALESIQSELRRREQVFREYEVNHINAYTELFRSGKAREPIPHLFIISDEFAELKKEQPEFMKELVSTARVGRSLGVHLILATQKPAGIVDEQIWSNSRFKICLKVQTESDSKEILHTADAANITQTGRAYLQVGNNEIFELFQSAWSGAEYVEEKEGEALQDNRVYLINDLGQGVLINRDLRGPESELRSECLQLDAVISHIRDTYEKGGYQKVQAPWLPPLSDQIVNPHLDTAVMDGESCLVRPGIADIPQEQEQREYAIDLTTEGNIVYVASGGYGKSMFLTNAALDLASHHPVSQLHLYILDFGNNALISLQRLPHTAAYIMLDENEKFEKFKNRISEEIRRRKKKMAEVMAQNFRVYNEIAKEKLHAIVILVDNYDAVKELGYEQEDYFTRVTRDGAGVGVYVIITASRGNAIRFATLNNFKNKIAGFNFEESEIRTLTGRSKYRLPEIRGRAMVKMGEQVNVMQLYTPVTFDTEVEYSRKIQEKVQAIAENNSGEQAPGIPILPEELSFAELMQYPHEKAGLVLGLDKEKVLPLDIDRTASPFLILGESGSGKTNAIKAIINQIPENRRVWIIDSRRKDLFSYREKGGYVTTTEELEDLANTIQKETKKRELFIAEAAARGEDPGSAAEALEEWIVIIDEIDDFITLAGSGITVIAARFEKAMQYGITFLISASAEKFKGTDILSQAMKNTRNGLLLSGQGYLTTFPLRYNEMPAMPDGVLMRNKQCVKIRLPEV